MAKKDNSGKITIANFIAIVGLVLLLVFTFLGRSYMSGGELGWDIVISVGITALTALLLWLLIKAKGAENNLDKWRILEYSTLGVFLIIAVLATSYGGIMHFFVVNNHKEEIKRYATEDLGRIEQMFDDYQNFEANAISRTGTGLHNATGPGQLRDDNLNDFMTRNQINGRESVANFEIIQKNKLIGAGFTKFKEDFNAQSDKIQDAVTSWSMMQIPMKAKQIEELAANAEKELTALSKSAKLPEVYYDSAIGKYTLGENQTREFRVDGGTDSFRFKKELREITGFSFIAILVVIFIYLMILFNYLVAYRTSTLKISKNSGDDSGRVL